MRWNAATKSRRQSMLIGQTVDGGRGAGPRVDCLEIDDYGGVKSPDGDVAAVLTQTMECRQGIYVGLGGCRRHYRRHCRRLDHSELVGI